MAILGITNRTENWKTARHFAPLFGAKSVRLARRLLAHEEERGGLQPGDARLELFWCGMRDYLHESKAKPEERREQLSGAYRESFSGLGEKVKAGGLQVPDGSYDPSTKDWESKLVNNLRNTEVDIALESPNHLFIGEAKHLSRFGASGRDFLTHQLIRQFVMAKILLKLPGNKEKGVVPFVVGDDRNYLKKTLQVQFMLCQGWMREENVLEWSDIEALW